MRYSTEDREAARDAVREIDLQMAESREAVKDAANRILDVCDQLHLTWDEFEKAVERVKRRGRISR